MGWEDRPYYREGRNATSNPLMWLLNGSVHLFTLFGIRVRAHASLIVVCALVLLFGMGFGESVVARGQFVAMLCAVVLLHEFGHCFAARWTGGSADEVLLTPLGGLAMTMARRRPWPTFVTVAGGPLVNVLLCLLCGLGLFIAVGVFPLGPWSFGKFYLRLGWLTFTSYLSWVYLISYGLLLFNLLPVFPLDGGQLLQSILWKPMGYYKSMLVTMNVGLVGSVLMILSGLGLIGFGGGLLVALIGLSCLLNCYRTRAMLKAEGPWAFSDEDSVDYGHYASASYRDDSPSRRRGWFGRLRSRRAAKAARAQAHARAAEQERIDAILAKVSAQGMNSLTWLEKRALRKATERQRKRDLEAQRRPRR
jgi:Zn-dependent protease